MGQDTSVCNGIKGYRSPDTNTIWLRDHTYQLSAFKYWESDMKGTIDAFLAKQQPDGSLHDFLCPYPVRIPVEADVEYLAVVDAFQVWQATGDDAWMIKKLPQLDKALSYVMASPDRWDKEHELVKRGFTIDLWDFQWGFGSNSIRPETRFGLLASDNSGFYLAAQRLAQLYARAGNPDRELFWNHVADEVKTNAQKYLWNDRDGYYYSFVHLEDPEPAVQQDESKILTLGNMYTMNRGDFASHDQSVRIIEAYQSRIGKAFKEWFSIDPNYGSGKFNSASQAEHPGGYVNGGIMPLVGGELAKAAFENGFESYGLQQITDYINMTKKAGNKTYLWYWPDGRPGKDEQTIPTDGWGSSAMLSAFIEGLVGIKDSGKGFEDISFSPRWPIAGVKDASITLRYGASDAYVGYEEHVKESEIDFIIASSGSVHAHILLPEHTLASKVLLNNKKINYKNTLIEKSPYVDFVFQNQKASSVRILLKSSLN